MYNPAIGYSQGMSDLVAPILAEVLDESDTFWCFVGLMQNTIFVSSPRDEDMEKQLVRLRIGVGGHGRGQAACGMPVVGQMLLMGPGGLWGRASSPRRASCCSPVPGRMLLSPSHSLQAGQGRALPWWPPCVGSLAGWGGGGSTIHSPVLHKMDPQVHLSYSLQGPNTFGGPEAPLSPLGSRHTAARGQQAPLPSRPSLTYSARRCRAWGWEPAELGGQPGCSCSC